LFPFKRRCKRIVRYAFLDRNEALLFSEHEIERKSCFSNRSTIIIVITNQQKIIASLLLAMCPKKKMQAFLIGEKDSYDFFGSQVSAADRCFRTK